jgi:hypothetical protein
MSFAVMAQDVSAILTSDPGPGAAIFPSVRPPRVPVRFQGGSKWAHLYSGPSVPAVPGFETVLHVNALCLPDGTISSEMPEGVPQEVFADTAFPLAAGPGISLGQFLTARLPGILAQRQTWEQGRIACAPPTAPQRDVLRRLGLFDNYVALTHPVRFRLAVGQSAAAPSAAAGAALRHLFAQVRAPATGTPRRIAILPHRDHEIFTLRNRASLTAWLRARRIVVIDPDALGFDALAAICADAALLILADSAQAGLIGLCHAETKIIEVVPEGFAGTAARSFSAAFGLEWALLLGSPPSYPVLQTLAFGARVPLAYEVPISALNAALANFGM